MSDEHATHLTEDDIAELRRRVAYSWPKPPMPLAGGWAAQFLATLDAKDAEIARLTQERDDARSEAVAHASEFAAMIVGEECHRAEQRGLDRAATLAEQRGHVTTADAIRALTPEGE